MDKQKLNQAEQFYIKNDYDLAADIYAEMLELHPDNPYLMINFANTQVKQKNFGKALAYYNRAKLIIPRNHELNNNIKHTTKTLQNFNSQSIFNFMFFNLGESLILLIVLNLLFLIFKNSKIQLIKYSLIGLFAISILNTAYVAYNQHLKNYAFVSCTSSSTHAGNNSGYPELFELSDGQIIEIIEQEKDWSKIKYKNQISWLENEKYELVKP